MPTYTINPYVSFIESRLFPGAPEKAVFHRLTGEIVEPSERVHALLTAVNMGNRISLNEDHVSDLGTDGIELRNLTQREFLIADGYDPLTHLLDLHVARPIQNPAVAYQSTSGEWILVRTSMEHTVYSRRSDELPPVIEEKMSKLTAEIFLLADGTRTLQQIFATTRGTDYPDVLKDSEFRTAIDFLTTQERQLIKLVLQSQDLNDPFKPVNIVPRNLYHSDRWDQSGETIIDFHLQGIEDAAWEFDLIEPTVNHGFRFPHEALGGLDYGSRFCVSTFQPEVFPLLDHSRRLNVLEVGGGTGSFARSFIKEALLNCANINYHILDLSPALMESQRSVLSELLPESQHFHQDATEFELPGHTFDLIISNEVIADFPVATVERSSGNEAEKWQGDGAYYARKYDLSAKDAPESFLINVGAFRFVERAWKHLTPGGTLIVSEYGAVQRYPARSFHLNHDEFSIHFGHLTACATKVGFQCRLLTLKDFLSLDDEVEVLNGREEHILCLNHVFKNYGLTLPYAVISKSDFARQCETVAREINLTGYSFSPIKMGYHFGPNVKDFFVLIMNKPT